MLKKILSCLVKIRSENMKTEHCFLCILIAAHLLEIKNKQAGLEISQV